jgi:RNA polymerase sigma-70 factor, ECF subfamily
MASDEDLMREFQHGSRNAFEELFARYRALLYGFFRRRVAERERAEDLLQETFLAVLRAGERYEPRVPFRTYLFGIALKVVAAERRRGHLPTATPEPVANSSDETIWVRQAIAKLDAPQREILMLREYEGLSYEEIATLLELPTNTVRSRLFRARMALKSCLEASHV